MAFFEAVYPRYRLIGRLKCLLGIHKWLHGEDKFSMHGEWRRVCVYCDRLEVDEHDGDGYQAAE